MLLRRRLLLLAYCIGGLLTLSRALLQICCSLAEAEQRERCELARLEGAAAAEAERARLDAAAARAERARLNKEFRKELELERAEKLKQAQEVPPSQLQHSEASFVGDGVLTVHPSAGEAYCGGLTGPGHNSSRCAGAASCRAHCRPSIAAHLWAADEGCMRCLTAVQCRASKIVSHIVQQRKRAAAGPGDPMPAAPAL